jgi:hypothetical protein
MTEHKKFNAQKGRSSKSYVNKTYHTVAHITITTTNKLQ